jgi:hypothetical protein
MANLFDKVTKSREGNNPAAEKEEDEGDLNLLRNIRSRIRDERGVIIYTPSADWNTPLFQRPHHFALQLSSDGYTFFYCTRNYVFDNIHGVQALNDNLYLTDRCDLLPDVFSKGWVFIASPTPFVTIEEIRAYKEKGFRIIYDYIDEIHPFITGVLTNQLERHHALNANLVDLVLTVSAKLYEEAILKFPREKVLFLPNGVDYEHFHIGRKAEECPKDMESIVHEGKPVIGYYGALARWIDYGLIHFVAEQRPDWNIVIIGVDYDGSMNELKEMPNVRSIGARPYRELPKYGVWFDVAMIPFKDGDLAKSSSPVKLYEYLAMNKPVVVTRDLVECHNVKGVLVACGRGDFIAKIEEALRRKDDPEYLRQMDETARGNTWQIRSAELQRKIRDLSSSGH